MRIPPMVVCPYCGPQNISYAGRVVSVVCRDCRSLIERAAK